VSISVWSEPDVFFFSKRLSKNDCPILWSLQGQATFVLPPYSPFAAISSLLYTSSSSSSSTSSSSSIGTTALSWVSACSTVVEHSQQGGFTECRCQPPTWRRTRDLERSNFRHKRPPASEATLANLAMEGGTMGEKWPRNFAESDDFHATFGFFYMP
jgi:hypothetical protein